MVTKIINCSLSGQTQGLTQFQNVQEVQKYLSKPTDRIICSYQNGVYDVTDFLSDHPGGDKLIERYRGKDITEVFKDENIHPHSQNAKRILAQYKTGEVIGDNKYNIREGEERAYPLRVGYILYFDDFQIDLSKGYLYQILKLSYQQYMEVIDNPVIIPFYVPLFDNKYLDMCSATSWYTVPMVWIPILITHFLLGLNYDYQENSVLDHFVKLESSQFSWGVVLLIFILSIFSWSISEYSLHRFLFHMEKWMPDHPLYRYLAFTIHGIHHALPMDQKRLVFPPSLAFLIYCLITSVVYIFLPGNAGRIFAAGFIAGYLYYDLMHYYLHHNNPQLSYLKELKSAHNKHHYLDDSRGFGITSKFWDTLFGTRFN